VFRRPLRTAAALATHHAPQKKKGPVARTDPNFLSAKVTEQRKITLKYSADADIDLVQQVYDPQKRF
jgi:hypothetical protein